MNSGLLKSSRARMCLLALLTLCAVALLGGRAGADTTTPDTTKDNTIKGDGSSSADQIQPQNHTTGPIIDTLGDRNAQVQNFGKPNTATYGQVVTVPAGNPALRSFTFLMNQPNTLNFRGMVYAWDGQKATGPALYESAPRTTSGEQPQHNEPITFNTGGILLNPGQQYVLLATISKDYAASSGQGSWGVVNPSTYAGGNFVFNNNGDNVNALTTTPWSSFGTGYDLAFRAAFSPPDPPPPPKKKKKKKKKR